LWDDIAGDNLLIPYTSINDAVDKTLPKANYDFTVVSCDPARFGNDKTAIYVIKNNCVIHYKILPHSDTMTTAGWCIKCKEDYKADVIIVDDNGLGAGVADRLLELKQPVYFMNNANKSDIKEYKNMRYEMWWNTQEMFINGEVSIPDNSILKNQLASLKYTMTSTGSLELQSKKDAKKKGDESPDEAEALNMGLWAMKNLTGMATDWEEDAYQRSIKKTRGSRTGY